MSAAEDQVAVDKVLLGDTEAFEGIVRRWQRPLVNLAYRFCRDAGRAEEMAQEAFLRAYRSLVPLDAIAEPRDPRAVDGGLGDADRDRALRSAVFALPPKYRETFILFYFHGMDIAATAGSLGLPEGTVKARLSRGREILRGKLSLQLGAPLLRKEA
jgi:RNA polymerase sigma-70 factor (ECF subfamily)